MRPFTFFTGIVVGMTLMYLFDPKAGEHRRARLRSAMAPSPEHDLEEAAASAKEAIDSAADAALNPTG